MSTLPSNQDLIELEKKIVVVADYFARDLETLGLSHIEYKLNIEETDDGPVISVEHNGDEAEGATLTNLFRTLLTEQEWPGL